MNNKENRKIEEILNSLDGVKKVAAPDFFYTRLNAKMLARQSGAANNTTDSVYQKGMLRPVYIIATLLLIVLINLMVLINNQDETSINSNNAIADNNESVQQSIATAYSLNDNNSVYDLNPEK